MPEVAVEETLPGTGRGGIAPKPGIIDHFGFNVIHLKPM